MGLADHWITSEKRSYVFWEHGVWDGYTNACYGEHVLALYKGNMLLGLLLALWIRRQQHGVLDVDDERLALAPQ